MNLQEIRNKFGNDVFTIASFNSKNRPVRPKQVTIDKNLIVWDRKTGNCIINGMREADFFADGTAHIVEKQFKQAVEEMNPNAGGRVKYWTDNKFAYKHDKKYL